MSKYIEIHIFHWEEPFNKSLEILIIILLLQERSVQFFYDTNSVDEGEHDRKRPRKDGNQQKKKQPPNFDQGTLF